MNTLLMKRIIKFTYTLLLELLLLLVPAVAQANDGRLFRVINAASGLADNSAQTILSLKDGRMAISTMGTINFYNGVGFYCVHSEAQDRMRLSNYRGNYHLYYDNRERLWLKHRYEVTCVDMNTEQLITSFNDCIHYPLNGQEIEDLFVDSDSTLWLSIGGKLTNEEQKIALPIQPVLNLQDVDVCDDKVLLFYENGMVEVFHRQNGKHIKTTYAYKDEEVEKYNSSSVLLRVGHSFYQIRNGRGHAILQRLNVDTYQWKTLLTCQYSLNNMALYNDQIYIPSAYGYYIYHKDSETIEHSEDVGLLNGSRMITDINTVAFDHQGGIWMGTERRGLLYSKPLTSPFIAYTWDDHEALEYATEMDRLGISSSAYSKRGINTNYTDSRGWLWVGTNNGLQLFKKGKAGEMPDTVLRISEGLLNNVVHSIIEDDKKNIWICTSNGISCCAIRDNRVKFISSYNDKDNVPSETFLNGRVMKRKDGLIVMQSLDHVVAFNPNRFQMLENTSLKLYPKLIRLMVNGNFIFKGNKEEGIYLNGSVSKCKHLELDNDKNSIRLTFSGFNYFRPLQTFYRVRMTGGSRVDHQNWTVYSYFDGHNLVDQNGVFHFPLMALEPGNYRVEVQASMFPYEWPTDPVVVTLTVREPWWQTTGVRLLVGFVIVVLLIVNIVWYNKNYKVQLQCATAEQDVLKRLSQFVERTLALDNERFLPGVAESYNEKDEAASDLDDDFVEMMLKVVPLIRHGEELSTRKIASIANMNLMQFYDKLIANINKSPRQLALALRLSKACEMLKEPDAEVEDVADACGYASPNFFISSFYHRYRITPKLYAEQHRSK